jgi:hypothetical protein
LFAGLVSLTLVAPATAAVTVQLTETSTTTVGSFSGSLDLTGLEFVGTTTFGGGGLIRPSIGNFSSQGSAGQGHLYSGDFSGSPFGTGEFSNVANPVGSAFGFFFNASTGFIIVPTTTVLPNTGPLSGSFNFGTDQPFASLGITAGTYVITLPSRDTITIIATPVPEPSTYALMLAGLGVVGFMARRRQTRVAAGSL